MEVPGTHPLNNRCCRRRPTHEQGFPLALGGGCVGREGVNRSASLPVRGRSSEPARDGFWNGSSDCVSRYRWENSGDRSRPR